MNAHEIIDRFQAKSPRAKVLTFLVIATVIIGVVGLAFWYGTIKSRQWADSEYLQKTADREAKIAVFEADAARHMKNETQLAAENALLKKQAEAMAEAQKQADTERERKALADLAKREADRANQFGEIDADQDFDSQICATCADFRKAGFPLSAEFCKRCEVKQ